MSRVTAFELGYKILDFCASYYYSTDRMTKAFANQIQHQHGALLLPQSQIEDIDEGMDWTFRKLEGPASDVHTEIVRQMRNIALDPNAWEAYGLPRGKREEALAACDEWLKEVGVDCVVHLEHE